MVNRTQNTSIMNTDITEKAKYYQEMNLWPRMQKLNYRGWLKNFEDNQEDLELAKLILDFFIYYNEDFVEQMIIAVVGKCGYKLQELNGAWSYEDFKNNCWYSFIPGEHPHDSDSGHIFIRKVRDVLRIAETQEIKFGELLHKLSSETIPQNVILVDDIVGSGSQCCSAWNNLVYQGGDSLAAICARIKHNVFYAPLLMNANGYKLVRQYCPDLHLETIHVLGNEYNLFHKDCLCWKGDEDLYNRGTEMILRRSKAAGIQDIYQNDPLYIKGLHSQGWAIAFSHGIPDACPPFFYWDQNGWTPLIIKEYPR